jgi:hypothetical protein
MSNWQPDEDDVLRREWGNISASQIGDLLGRTRNMVIGRARRLKLKLLRKPSPRKRGPSWNAGLKMVHDQPFQETLFAPPSLAVSILDLGQLQCSYIEGDDHLCCGQPAVNGKRWCSFHYRVVYRPIDRNQRAKSSLAAE